LIYKNTIEVYYVIKNDKILVLTTQIYLDYLEAASLGVLGFVGGLKLVKRHFIKPGR